MCLHVGTAGNRGEAANLCVRRRAVNGFLFPRELQGLMSYKSG
jgi:hypothetical protein